MIEEYEYPDECPECGKRMRSVFFFPPVSQTKSKMLYVGSVPLMATWAFGIYLFLPVHIIVAGNLVALLVMALVYLGPGVLLVGAGMFFSRVRHAEGQNCRYSVDVRGPNMFGMR